MNMPELAGLPPIVCTPWCEDQDWGPAAYVDLSLEEVARGNAGVYPPRLGAMAYRQRPCTLPCVYVHLSDVVIGKEPVDSASHLTAAETESANCPAGGRGFGSGDIPVHCNSAKSS
jgi:hypothetical protein